MKNRKKYYETLREFQTTGNINPTIELILLVGVYISEKKGFVDT